MAAETAAELHQRAVLDGVRGRHAAARRQLRRALRLDPDAALSAQILLSLAYYEAERAGIDAGLLLLERADGVPGLPDRIRGTIASQRGLVFMRAGRAAESLAAFDAALKLLGEDDAQYVCRALLNRGILQMQRGATASARADFLECVAVAGRHGFDLMRAKASHNLGYLSLLSGDLPRALREMDAVGALLGGQSPTFAAVCYADRAQVLLAAGLFREADEDLRRAEELFRAGGVPQDRAEAELARAQVALIEERWRDARRLAGAARRRFASRGAASWALLAAHVRVAADVGQRRDLRGATDTAVALARELAAAGLGDEARRAALTAAGAALARGDLASARTVAGRAARLRRDDPIATRLQARAVRSATAEAGGRPDLAQAELRAALRDLHRYQASFGSLDLQTAVSGFGRRLAERGLAHALASGGPAAVFDWAERARAMSARLPPIVPPADEEAASMLEELRRGRVELRGQALSGRVDPALRQRCRQLEQHIRQRSWHLTGPGQVTEAAPLGHVQDRASTVDGTLVAHLLSGGELHALVVGRRHRTVRHLGPAAPVLELHHRLRADLDVLAGDLPDPIREAVRTSYRSTLAALDAALWQPLRPLLGAGPLLLAPSAPLVTVAWTLLPSTRGRPSTVVASTTAWLSAGERVRLPARPEVAIAAGPQVQRAVQETDRIAAVWSRTATLPVERATSAAVRAAAAASDLLHVAAHGVHEPDNPLFSHLVLADGPLFGHELDGLARLPAHVVLSACELGLSRTRPGDETLGMTAALLHGGAGSVVAGVARIADAVACQVGPAHHVGLRSGKSPAEALADAVSSSDEPAPLVCFGAGW